ncbi:hypothetical protein J2W14_002363 [Pseudarthrobacter oxydans]|nr:hypothetical protein [Pseudarthrobacter oxydans]
MVAYLNSERVDATQMDYQQWRAMDRKDFYPELVLPQCGIRAIRYTSRKGTPYFAHYGRGSIKCTVKHKAESEAHLVMKRAVAERINAAQGWTATVEYAPGSRAWIADVLAERKDGKRFAFEVQLSKQSREQYGLRSQRYFEEGIHPVWLVPKLEEFRELKVPMLGTGFAKDSKIPDVPAQLMESATRHCLTGAGGNLGQSIDGLLGGSITWEHGSPSDQWRAQQENKRRVREVFGGYSDGSFGSNFARAAERPDVLWPAARQIRTRYEMHIWASVIRCPESACEVLVWHAQESAVMERLDAENRWQREVNWHALEKVDEWLLGSDAAVRRAVLRGVAPYSRGAGAFLCPCCSVEIPEWLIVLLPSDKWSLVAVPGDGDVPAVEGRPLKR